MVLQYWDICSNKAGGYYGSYPQKRVGQGQAPLNLPSLFLYLHLMTEMNLPSGFTADET